MHLARSTVRPRLIGVLPATLVALSGVAATEAASASDPDHLTAVSPYGR